MQGPVQNFRGLSALLVTQEKENRDSDILKNTLGKLGIAVTFCDPSATGECVSKLATLADVIVVDIDAIETADAALFADSSLPVIALVGLESPTRLQRAHDIEPTALIMKPVRSNGIFTALYFAFNERRRRQQLKDAVASATERLAARRLVVKAIVYLMQNLGLDDEEAYRHLRKESMSRRISVEELSAQILAVKSGLLPKKTRA